MTTQQFIEKAIEGGWKPKQEAKFCLKWSREEGEMRAQIGDSAFLDPAAWKAVGKVEGWEPIGYADLEYQFFDTINRIKNMAEWNIKMHRLIDALAEGKTIEDFLATL